MTWWWIFFAIFILAVLTLDLGVFSRRAHTVKIKESLYWIYFWVVLAIGTSPNYHRGEIIEAS